MVTNHLLNGMILQVCVSFDVISMDFHLLKGLITYLYRGYNPVTKYHGHPSRDYNRPLTRIPIKQPGFNGFRIRPFFSFSEVEDLGEEAHLVGSRDHRQ